MRLYFWVVLFSFWRQLEDGTGNEDPDMDMLQKWQNTDVKAA